MEELSQDQRRILAEFRTRISDLKRDEFESHNLYLLTWLRAREFDLEKAEQMIRRSYEWRAEYDFDNILTSWEVPPNYFRCFPYEVTGYDEERRPLIIVPVCVWDGLVRKELAAGRKEQVHRFIVNFCARRVQEAKARSDLSQNILAYKYSVIFDLAGFSLKHLTSPGISEVMLENFRRFERNFPESLTEAYVVNAPKLFALLFPLVKQMLAPKTIAKVRLFDCNAEKWRAVLRAKFPESILPVYYGGTAPDTLQEKAKAAKIDDNGFSSAGICVDALTTIRVDPGSKVSLEYEIKESGTRISWIFKTEGYDIGFFVKSNDKFVVEKKRVKAQVVEEGSVSCPHPGKYTLTFDNTYSLFRGKTLYYVINIENDLNQNEISRVEEDARTGE